MIDVPRCKSHVLGQNPTFENSGLVISFFFFNDPATTEIYTLSLHDALPICRSGPRCPAFPPRTSRAARSTRIGRSEEHTSERQSRQYLVCRLLLGKKKQDREQDVDEPPSRRGSEEVRALGGVHRVRAHPRSFCFAVTAPTEISPLSLHAALPI